MYEAESEEDDIQYYRLEGWKLICCELGDWATSVAKNEHILEDSEIKLVNDKLVRVTTCLMGYDLRHDYEEIGDQLCDNPNKKLLFETIVIGLVELPDELIDLYSSTVLEAKQAHYKLLIAVKNHLKSLSLLDISVNLDE